MSGDRRMSSSDNLPGHRRRGSWERQLGHWADSRRHPGAQELRTSIRVRLTVSRAFGRGAEGTPQDPQIEPKGLMVDVPHVESEPVAPGQVSASVDLGPSRDARPHRVPAPLLRRVASDVANQQWPGTDEAHVAAKDV